MNISYALLECELLKNKNLLKNVSENSEDILRKVKKLEEYKNLETADRTKKWDNLKKAFEPPILK